MPQVCGEALEGPRWATSKTLLLFIRGLLAFWQQIFSAPEWSLLSYPPPLATPCSPYLRLHQLNELHNCLTTTIGNAEIVVVKQRHHMGSHMISHLITASLNDKIPTPIVVTSWGLPVCKYLQERYIKLEKYSIKYSIKYTLKLAIYTLEGDLDLVFKWKFSKILWSIPLYFWWDDSSYASFPGTIKPNKHM